jgi:hypothetical protein
MGRPSKYPEEFRREAVERYRSSDRSRCQVAESLGISDRSLRGSKKPTPLMSLARSMLMIGRLVELLPTVGGSPMPSAQTVTGAGGAMGGPRISAS